ncbi:hypothetical protein FJ251_08020 [bacterium]|nr:hypothetical protein [bacterium]
MTDRAWPALLAMALLFAGAAARAQSAAPEGEEAPAVVDTTITTPEGIIIRYKGVLPPEDAPGSPERVAQAFPPDDRVPLGYGFKSLRFWKEGDPRPGPQASETRVITEFVDLQYAGPYVPKDNALAMAEFADYTYFGIKERLGWALDAPFPLAVPLDLEHWGSEMGLPWWVPGDVQNGRVVLQPISVITSRGMAQQCLTHYYVEWQLRRRTGERIPYWFLYGAGAFFGDEGSILEGQVVVLKDRELDVDFATMTRDLEIFRDRELMLREVAKPGLLEEERLTSRIAYWRAFRLVRGIMLGEGLGPFKALVAAMEAEPALSFADAVQRHYGKSLDDLIAAYSPR